MIIRLPWALTLTVEHIICADIHHLDIQRFADLCDIPRAFGIDSAAQLHVICGTVDHCVRLCLFDHAPAGLCVGDIHFLHVHTNSFDSLCRQLIHHIMAQLSFYARYQNSHNLKHLILPIIAAESKVPVWLCSPNCLYAQRLAAANTLL